MKIQEKMRKDWDRRAEIDPYYWVAATQEADQQSYDRSAEKDTTDFISGLATIMEQVISAETPLPGAILDLGCGIGRMTALLSPYFNEVVGVDVSKTMIDKARTLHSANPARFEVNSGSDLSAFDEGSFDVVCSYSVLAHLPPDVVTSYFCEVGRILCSEGVFRYQFWVGPSHHPDESNSLSIHVYDEAQLSRLHEDAGLIECAREEIDYLDPILNLKPVWITARRVATPQQARPLDRETTATLSPEERQLEYELMLYLAMKHYDRGERIEAEGILERATHFAPQLPEAYLHWATSRIEQDDLNGALLLLEVLTQKCPEHPQGWFFLTQAALGEGHIIKAEGYFKRLEELDLDDEDRSLCLALKEEIEREKLSLTSSPTALNLEGDTPSPPHRSRSKQSSKKSGSKKSGSKKKKRGKRS
jgi:SAM-dependent methyltransferase